MHRNDPIIALATPPGRGAVGMVRISGANLRPWAEALLGRPLQTRYAHRIRLTDAGAQLIDEVIAIYFEAPNSYTGENVLEIQGHGGPVVLHLVQQRCLAVAAQIAPDGQPWLSRLRPARPGEFTERAFLNHKLDLAQAEAVADLIDASTERAARSASRSLSGAFSKEIQMLLDELTRLRLLIETGFDFPEEDVDSISDQDVRRQLDGLQQRLGLVLQRSQQGALLREGLRVVIAGQPNAGKSSLLNALVGAERAIVTAIAGTTRDPLTEALSIDGVPLHIVDTAGLRDKQDPQLDAVERIGIERAWAQIDLADAVLLLSDITRRSDPQHQRRDQDIENQLRQRLGERVPIVYLWNKSDALQPADMPWPDRGLTLSAKTGQGLPALRQQLLQLAGFEQHASEDIYMARTRHLQALRQVQQHLGQAQQQLTILPSSGAKASVARELLAEDLRQAQQALAQITGAFDADDLLGLIFSRFCIGK